MRPEDMIGEFFSGVELETCRDIDLTRPRVRALGEFDPNIRVEFPRDLRERFPIGTRYQATVGLLKKSLPSIGFRPWRMEDVRGPSRPDVAGFPFRREFARVGQR